MKQILRKGISIFIAMLLIVTPLAANMQAAATEFRYPAGVSAAKAEEIVASADTLLLTAANKVSGKTLADNVLPMLYEGDLLGAVTIGIYKALSAPEMAEMLSALAISVTPADLSAVLFAYPEVSKALASTSSWNTADLSGISWNVHNKTEFAAAVGAILSPLHTMLQFLLCEGNFSIVGNIIKVKGGNGYSNAVVPLFEAIGCTDYLSYSDYKNQSAANAQATGANLILPLLNYAEKVLCAPLTQLCSILPNLAYFIINDGVENTINALLTPVTELASTIEKIPLLNSVISDSGLGNLSDDFAGNLVPDLNGMLAGSEMNISLPEINWELLASCGTVNGNKVNADKGKTFVTVFRWLWKALQANSAGIADMMAEMMPQDNSAATEMDLSSVLSAFLQDDADTVIKALAFMLKPDTKPGDVSWVYGNITTSAYNFTEAMPREDYAKMIDGFNNLLGSLIAETLGAASLDTAINAALYTNDNITSILKTVYALFESEELSAVASLLGINTSVSAVLGKITEDNYKNAVTFLTRYKTWDEMPADGLNWGFADGDKTAFIAACAAVLRPMQPLLSFILAEGDYMILDSITVKGGNGYNNAIIPLFEALGVDSSLYVTPAEYKSTAGTDAMLTNILTPVFTHIESICASPVSYLTKQLPTICYFITDGGLSKIIYAITWPLLMFISDSGLSIDIMSVLDEAIPFDLTLGEDQINSLLTEMQNSEDGIGIVLPEIPAIATLASLGTVQEADSKRTFNGNATTYKYITADQESVMAYLVDFIVDIMQNPANSEMMMGSFMGGAQDDASNPFAAYTETFSLEMEGMTHDEMIRWFYDMLVFESASDDENSNLPIEVPHIIYEEQDGSNSTGAAVAIVVILLLAGAAAFIIIRKKKAAKTTTKKEETEE